MAWNKVAVVGAGLIKFGELFDQSYEQMAAGAFKAASEAVDTGFDPSLVGVGRLPHRRHGGGERRARRGARHRRREDA